MLPASQEADHETLSDCHRVYLRQLAWHRRHSLVRLHLLDPAWNPQHISGLPAEIRAALAHMCGGQEVKHRFASYSQGSRVLVLHFEHFRWGDGRTLYTHAGCLHQVYTSTGGRYRLLRHRSRGRLTD